MTRQGAEAVRERWMGIFPHHQWRVVPVPTGYGLKAAVEVTNDEWAALYEDWRRNPVGLPPVPRGVWDRPGLAERRRP